MSTRKPVRNKFWGSLLAIAITFCLAAGSSAWVNADDQGGISNLTCSPDMISYWKLDETAGTTFEDYIGSNDGVCTGDQCPLPEEGIVNGAQRFLGSQEIDVPFSPEFNWDGSSNFSIELWVNIPENETCDGRMVFFGRHAGLRAWWVGCADGSNKASFYLRDQTGSHDDGKMISGGPALNDGQWHHIVAVRDGSNNEIQLFVDGKLEASAQASFAGDWISEKEINIGYYNVLYGGPPWYFFVGLLDEIAIYGRALPLDEIQYHYQNGLDGKGYCQPVELVIYTEGAGSVTRSDPGPYTFGQVITLTAEPDPGNIFYEWSGDLTGYANPAPIKLNGNKVVTARFSTPIYYTLAVDINGFGLVIIEPDLDQYLHGTTVLLSAIPKPGSVFTGWSGDLNGNKNPEEILMTANFTITAEFVEAKNTIFLPLTFK